MAHKSFLIKILILLLLNISCGKELKDKNLGKKKFENKYSTHTDDDRNINKNQEKPVINDNKKNQNNSPLYKNKFIEDESIVDREDEIQKKKQSIKQNCYILHAPRHESFSDKQFKITNPEEGSSFTIEVNSVHSSLLYINIETKNDESLHTLIRQKDLNFLANKFTLLTSIKKRTIESKPLVLHNLDKLLNSLDTNTRVSNFNKLTNHEIENIILFIKYTTKNINGLHRIIESETIYKRNAKKTQDNIVLKLNTYLAHTTFDKNKSHVFIDSTYSDDNGFHIAVDKDGNKVYITAYLKNSKFFILSANHHKLTFFSDLFLKHSLNNDTRESIDLLIQHLIKLTHSTDRYSFLEYFYGLSDEDIKRMIHYIKFVDQHKNEFVEK